MTKRTLVFVFVAGALLAGCSFFDGGGSGGSSRPDPGSVEVQWRITAINKSCGEAGVVSVAAELEFQGEVAYADKTSCSEPGLTLSGVSPGLYTLVVSGLDDKDRPVYRGTVEGIQVRSRDVTQVGAVILERVPAVLEVGWHFANALTCGRNEVQSVDLWVYDYEEEKVIVDRMTYECDRDAVELEIRPGMVTVIASASDASGHPVFAAHQEVEAQSGEHLQVELTLQRCEEGSTEPGC